MKMLKFFLTFILICFTSVNVILCQFSQPIEIANNDTHHPTSFSIVDLNNDTFLDIISVSCDSILALHKNIEGIKYSQQIIIDTIPSLHLVNVKDLDVDNHLEIVVITSDGKLSILKNKKQDNFKIIQTIEFKDKEPLELYIENIDHDKELEIIILSKYNISIVDINNNDVFNIQVVNKDEEFTDIEIIDIDNDKDLDICALSLNGDLVCFQNMANGDFFKRKLFNASNSRNSGSTFEVADIDNDEELDFIIAVPKTRQIVYYENVGDLKFAEAKELANKSSYTNLFAHVIDIDNDGDQDILRDFQYSAIGLSWLDNLGKGEFKGERGYPKIKVISKYSARPVQFYNLDFNNDGFMDMVYIDYYYNILGIYINNQDNTFKEQIISTGTYLPGPSQIVDMDSDNQFEIVSSLRATRQLVWYDFNGDKKPVTSKQVGLSSSIGGNFVAADFDGDGYTDFVSAPDERITRGRWTIPRPYSLFKHHPVSKTFQESIIDSTLLNFRQLFAKDIDNDGDQDLIINYRLRKKHKLSYKLNNGNGEFSEDKNIVNSERKIVAFLDFNNDGLDDILTVNFSSNINPLFLTNSVDGNFKSQPLNIGDIKAQIYAHDFDADGDSDLLIYSDTTYMLKNNEGLDLEEKYHIPKMPIKIKALDVADIDNDNDLDIIVSNREGKIYAYYNLGDNNYELKEIEDLELFIDSLFCFDFDYDGDKDIVLFSKSKSKIIWLSNLYKSE